jgi:hypothetical protein
MVPFDSTAMVPFASAAMVPFDSTAMKKNSGEGGEEKLERIKGEMEEGIWGRDGGGDWREREGKKRIVARVFVFIWCCEKNNGQDSPSGKIQRTRGSDRCETPYGGHRLYL